MPSGAWMPHQRLRSRHELYPLYGPGAVNTPFPPSPKRRIKTFAENQSPAPAASMIGILLA
jgi:hypothetical protein